MYLCAEGVCPLLGAVRVDRVKLPIPRPHVYRAVGRYGRRAAYLAAGWKAPCLCAVRIESVEAVVVRANVDRSIVGDCWRRSCGVAHVAGPLECSVGVERVEGPTSVDTDRAVGGNDARGIGPAGPVLPE